jgi:hypothetical protein
MCWFIQQKRERRREEGGAKRVIGQEFLSTFPYPLFVGKVGTTRATNWPKYYVTSFMWSRSCQRQVYAIAREQQTF